MLAVRNRFETRSQDSQQIPARKPLQSRNTNVLNSTVAKLKSVIKRHDAPKRVSEAKNIVIKNESKGSEEIVESDCNKENIPVMIEELDSSLGAELIEMRKRADRLKLDKEEIEKMLKNRDDVFQIWIENSNRRSEEQRKLETEIDRIFSRISLAKSRREKQAPLSILKCAENDLMESVGENSDAGSPERRRTGCVGEYADGLELSSVSAESR